MRTEPPSPIWLLIFSVRPTSLRSTVVKGLTVPPMPVPAPLLA